jgi:uncharacterized membrane protein YiaA
VLSSFYNNASYVKKIVFKTVLIIGILTLVVGILLFAPIDRRPLSERDFYISMMAKLDTVVIEEHVSDAPLLYRVEP